MLKIDCKSCGGLCCTSKIRTLFVVLTPQETEKFKNYTEPYMTPHGEITIMKRTEAGNCVFFDAEKKLCSVYHDRPFECRMYPYIIYHEKEIDFKLDGKFCPKINECTHEEVDEDKSKWLAANLPEAWVKSYTSLDN